MKAFTEIYIIYFKNINLVYVPELWYDFYKAALKTEPDLYLDTPTYVKICLNYRNTK